MVNGYGARENQREAESEGRRREKERMSGRVRWSENQGEGQDRATKREMYFRTVNRSRGYRAGMFFID